MAVRLPGAGGGRVPASQAAYLAKYLEPAKAASSDTAPPKKKAKKVKEASKAMKIVDVDEGLAVKPKVEKSAADLLKERASKLRGLSFADEDEDAPVVAGVVHEAPSQPHKPSSSWVTVSEGVSKEAPPTNKEPEEDGDLDDVPRRRHDSPPLEQDDDLDLPRMAPTQEPELKAKVGSDGVVEVPAPAKMQSGVTAGLTSAQSLRTQMEEIRAKEARKFQGKDEKELGKGEEVVFRDRKGRRLEGLEEFLRQQDGKKDQEREEQYEWGKGRVQKREAVDMQRRLEEEKERPLAQYRDDTEYDQERREVDRWGDPMAGLVSSNRPKVQTRPQYRGPPPPANRFNIMPDYLWDGVDRSNGFEKKLFERQAQTSATKEEAYLWSVADM